MTAVQTKGRTVVYLDNEAIAEVDELVPYGSLAVVSVGRAERGRATGWWVGCSDHGVMPVLAPSKTLAIIGAGKHLEVEHHGTGRIEVRG